MRTCDLGCKDAATQIDLEVWVLLFDKPLWMGLYKRSNIVAAATCKALLNCPLEDRQRLMASQLCFLLGVAEHPGLGVYVHA